MIRGTNSLMLHGRHWANIATCSAGWWMTTYQVGYQWYVSSGWQASSKELYDAAAEVAAKVR